MKTRQISQLIRAAAISEGAGVTVHRTLGTPARRHFDPFLMLDHFGSDNPDEYIAGFPDHPHRGFITLTYMLDGHMLHQDSMGNKGDLRAGGAQWMKAASGVIHSEMPQQNNGLMRGFQLWINLPAAEKMSDPAYQEFSPGTIPEVQDSVENGGARVRILSGEFGGRTGPIKDPFTHVQYLDVSLNPQRTFSHAIGSDMNACVYVFEGDAAMGDTPLPQHTLAILGDGERVEITAGAASPPTPLREAERGANGTLSRERERDGERVGARFILIAGRPINEPIVQYGPFVMSTREEIEQAFQDYRDGRLVRKKALMSGA